MTVLDAPLSLLVLPMMPLTLSPKTLPKSDVLRLNVLFPSYETVELTFSTNKAVDTVADLIQYVWEQAPSSASNDGRPQAPLVVPFPHSDADLLHERTEVLMLPHKLLRAYKLEADDRLVVVQRSSNARASTVEYAEFIRSAYPELNTSPRSTVDFPTSNGCIVLKFGASRKRQGRLGLCAAALVDCRALPTCQPQDMVRNLGGNMREARRRGFVQWTDKDYPHRMFLLRLSGNAASFGFNDFSSIEHLRYSATGVLNNGYTGGDSRSWQRYTTEQPIPCTMSEETVYEFHHPICAIDGADVADSARPDDEEGEEVSVVRAAPSVPLAPNSYYAVLLANGVPVVPSEGSLGGLLGFTCAGTSEDLLIVFKTADLAA